MLQFWGSWQSFALASAFFASLTAIFGKIGVANINSDLATLIRTIVIFFVLVLLITYKKNWISPAEISWKGILFLVLSGIATGFSWIFYYRALQLGDASRVAPLDKLSLVFTLIFALFFLGEPFRWQVILGALFMVAGSILLIF